MPQEEIIDQPDHAWQKQALCAKDENLEIFVDVEVEACKAVCAQCPVSNPCLEYALTHAHDLRNSQMVWGGKTRLERVQILRRREPHTRNEVK